VVASASGTCSISPTVLPPSARAAVVFLGELAGEHEHGVADAQLGVTDATVGHDDRVAEQVRVEHLDVPGDRRGRVVAREIGRERVETGGCVLADLEFGRHGGVLPVGSELGDDASPQLFGECRTGREGSNRLAQCVEGISRHPPPAWQFPGRCGR
jgi:hypothetical protein